MRATTVSRPAQRSSRPWRRARAAILRTSTICWLCGEDGADSVDHVIPVALGGTNALSNLRPAHHHVPNSRGVRCNMVKGDKLVAPVMKRSGSLAAPVTNKINPGGGPPRP